MDWERLGNTLCFVWLVSLMLQMGLSATFSQVIESAKRFKPALKALSANFLFVPLGCFALLLLFDPKPMVYTGFLIAVVFCGASLAPVCTSLAKGDVPYSIGLMILLVLPTPILSPALLDLLLRHVSQGQIKIDYLRILTIIVLGQVVPLMAGLAIRRLLPSVASLAVKSLRPVNNILLLLVTAILTCVHQRMLGMFGFKAFVGMAAAFALSAAIGWWLGGPRSSRRKALMSNTTIRNVPVALVVVSTNFPDTPAVACVIVYSLFSTALTFLIAFIIGKTPVPTAGSRSL